MASPAPDYDMVLGSPVGRFGICLYGERVTRVDYLPATRVLMPATSRFGDRVTRDFESYFKTAGYRFSVPVEMTGTTFQQRVWQALMDIPAGEVRTYGELASRLGSGARAVGNACRQNPVSIIVPCHRVVSATGMGGYAGETRGRALDRKHWLLEHEGYIGLENSLNRSH
jgi:methylated-DNA-[protein]-cysteine S-methyltransferase